MSDDLRRQHIRTQGKYSEVRKVKTQDKRLKISPGEKEPPEKKYSKYVNKSHNKSSTDEDISPIKYEEKSSYCFEQLEKAMAEIEVLAGVKILSKTENGESRLYYQPQFLELAEADEYFNRLYDTVNWSNKNIIINGEEHPQPRLVAWFGPYSYSYSGTTLEPAEMPELITEIRKKVEQYLRSMDIDVTFNSVLLNLYRNNHDSVAWHSDDESTMGICPTIASVSLGEVRKFEMKPKNRYSHDGSQNKQHFYVHLVHGSLVVMDGSMQDDWLHRVPKEYHDKRPRINLTFRTVYSLDNISPEATSTRHKERVNRGGSSNRKSDYEINFEDFPPLKSDHLSAHSDVKKNTKRFSSDSFFTKDVSKNNSQEKWDIENSVSRNMDTKSNGNTYEDFSLSEWDDLSTHYDVKKNTKRISSDSFFTKNTLNKSQEKWDIKNSVHRKWDTKNDENNCADIHESHAINHAKCTENKVGDTSYEMNSVENHLDDLEVSSCNSNESRPLNAYAKVFIPNIPVQPHNIDYFSLPLEELLTQNFEYMNKETISQFIQSLKENAEERLSQCVHSIREELQFIIEILDGSQSHKNLKVIAERMVKIMRCFVESQTPPVSQRRNLNEHHSSSFKRNNYREHQAFPISRRNNYREYDFQKSSGKHIRPYNHARQNFSDGGKHYSSSRNDDRL